MAEVDEILLGFVEEVEGYIPALREGADELRVHPDNLSALDEMRRLVHIVRGASAMLGVEPLSRAAKSMEEALVHVRDGKAELGEEALSALEGTAELFERYAAHLAASGAEPDPALAEAVDGLCALIGAIPVEEKPAPAFLPDMSAMDALDALFGEDAPAAMPGEEPESAAGIASIELDEELLASFNEEVEEHFGAINAALLKLGDRVTVAMPVDEGIREEMLILRRAVHTVKGASAVLGMQQIADVGRRIEEVLDWCCEEAAEIGPERMEALALTLDQFETLVRRPADFDAAVVDAGLEELRAGGTRRASEESEGWSEELTTAAPGEEALLFADEAPAFADETPAFAADEGEAVLALDEEPLAAAEAEEESAPAGEADEEEEETESAEIDPDTLDVNELFAADAPAGMVEDRPVEDFLSGMGVQRETGGEDERFTEADAEEMEEELFGSATADELFASPQPGAEPPVEELFGGDAGPAEDLFGATPEDSFPDAGLGMADMGFDEASGMADMPGMTEETADEAAPTMTAGGFELDDELLEGFKEEADEHLATIGTSLATLGNLVEEATPMTEPIREELRAVRRAVHTVKGASAVLGMKHIADVGHRIEDALDWFYEEATEIGPDQMATLAGVLDQFETLVRRPAEFDAAIVDAGLAELQAGMAAAPKAAAATVVETTPTTLAAPAVSAGVVAAPAEPTMTVGGFELDEELLASFTEEVNEHFETIAGSLNTLGNLVEETVPMNPTISEELRGVRRAVHTVKGASAVLGLQHIADVGHRIEDALDWFYEEASEIGPEQMAILSLVLDQFENLVRAPESYDATVVDEGMAALQAWIGDAVPKTAAAPSVPAASAASSGAVAVPTEPTMTAGGFELDEELLASFTEEVNEHFETIAGSLNTLGNLVEETVPMTPTISEELRAVRRAVHTVKGASAVIGLQHIADVGHRIEDALDWFYEEASEIGPEQMATLSLVLDQFENLVRTPDNYDAQVVDEGMAALHAWMGDAAPVPKPVAPAPEPVAEDSGSMSAALFSEEEQEMLRAGFMEEAAEHLNEVSRVLQSVESKVTGPTPMDAELREELREIRRSVHTIKGASAVIGLNDISSYAHKVEDFLDWFFEEAECADLDTVGLLAESLDLLHTVVEDPASAPEERKRDIYARLNEARGAASEAAPAPAAPTAAPAVSPVPSRFPTLGLQDEDEEHVPLTEQEVEDLRRSFAEEADLHVASLHRSVQFLSGHISGTAPPSAVLEETGRMYELLRSLRKEARILGNGDVQAFAGMLADFLGWARTGAVAVSPALLDALGDSVDILDQLMEDPDLVDWERQSEVCDKLETLRKHAIPPEPAPASAAAEPAPAFADIAPALEDLPASPVDLPASPVDLPAAGPAGPAPDAPKHAVADEAAKTIRIHQNQLDRFINLANELLVGVSGFDRNMGRFQEALNELDLAARRLKDIALELETKFEVKALGEITDHFDRIREEAREITADIRNLAEFDSLELDHYTQLNLIIRALNESAIDVSALQTTLAGIRSGLRGDINRQHRTVRELQVRLMDARLSPMSILTPRLSRTMRDAAARLKKRVRLVTEGDTVELDRVIWEKLADPFMHMVRNSIDHGIETPEERAAVGKPAIATIRLKGEREGNHVMIRFSDDGRGLNLEAIREKARKALDLGDEADDLEREQLIDLIFDNGFSTQKEVTQMSGRGVGMDVVKQNVLDLQGSINVDTETGRGTEFAIRVPLTLGLMRVLLVDMASVTYGIPITDIQEVRRVPHADIDVAGGSFLRGGEKTPLYDLPQLLLREESVEVDHEVGPIIFTILTERGPVGIRIPHITGQEEVVIKGLGSHLRAVTGIAGAAVMGDGSVIPLLNMDELLAAFLIQGMPQVVQVRPEAQKPKALTVMIVDDSISIRRVMSRLVSNHGWIPVECKDGQDAFEKLDATRPDCILLDIEMPRMNGFEFLTLKANLPDHKDIPVVMLTSRSSDKHRNKAFELGASMFLNKPSKDEDLVEAVLGLTGHRGDRFNERMAEVAL